MQPFMSHVGNSLHRGRMASEESNKGADLASRLTIRFFVVTEKRAKGNCQKPIAGSHSPAFNLFDIPQRRLHKQKGSTGDYHRASCSQDRQARWFVDKSFRSFEIKGRGNYTGKPF